MRLHQIVAFLVPTLRRMYASPAELCAHRVPGSGPPRTIDIPRGGRFRRQPRTRTPPKQLGGHRDRRSGDAYVRARLRAGAPVPGRRDDQSGCRRGRRERDQPRTKCPRHHRHYAVRPRPRGCPAVYCRCCTGSMWRIGTRADAVPGYSPSAALPTGTGASDDPSTSCFPATRWPAVRRQCVRWFAGDPGGQGRCRRPTRNLIHPRRRTAPARYVRIRWPHTTPSHADSAPRQR